MKIYVVGNSGNHFLLNEIRTCFFTDHKHVDKNIDFLNPWYCELTGMYHLRMNSNDDIVGLEHYRRYFVNDKGNLLNEFEVRTLLSDCDILLRKWDFIKRTRCKTSWEYLAPNTKEYILKFLNTLNKDEREFILNELMSLSYFAQCNMFIGRKQILDEYCDWFIEHATCFTSKDLIRYPRCVGYVSEFLFGAYLKMKNLKIKWQKSVEYDRNTKRIIGWF